MSTRDNEDELLAACRIQIAEGVSEENLLERIRVQLVYGEGCDDWDKTYYAELIRKEAQNFRTERRREQKRIASLVGEGKDAPAPPLADRLTLAEAEQSLVYITDGRQVVDDHLRSLPFADFDAAYANSRHSYFDEKGKEKSKSVAQAWLASPNRRTASALTFAPGRGGYTVSPVGENALNTWQARNRGAPPSDWAARCRIFTDHVSWLFGEYAPIFLNWLAHIEQQPGVLPHFGWLHIARHHGMGRNWIACVLAQVWRGNVAAAFDLLGTLESSFNQRLSRCLLAIVDEINESGGLQWKHANALRQSMTAEYRTINIKYGRLHIEYNCCRHLLFSNHRGALPLDDNDRRFFVVESSDSPRDVDYYKELYGASADPAFIASVARFLQTRDLSGFRPGERPPMTEAKKTLVQLAKTEAELFAEQVVEAWPVDVIYLSEFKRHVDGASPRALTFAMDRAGLQRWSRRQLRGGYGGFETPYIIRNPDRWMTAEPDCSPSAPMAQI
jgi:hypothetical protein